MKYLLNSPVVCAANFGAGAGGAGAGTGGAGGTGGTGVDGAADFPGEFSTGHPHHAPATHSALPGATHVPSPATGIASAATEVFDHTSTGSQAPRYGQSEIAAVSAETLERWPNSQKQRFLINITLPEFACRCPRSGYPDFATLRLEYVPRKWLIELKALKLYINSFYGRHISHEAAISEIFAALKKRLKPRYIKLVGDFNPRGNVYTQIICEHKRKKKSSVAGGGKSGSTGGKSGGGGKSSTGKSKKSTNK